MATRIATEFAERIGQASLVGELVAGVFLGLLARQYSGAFPVLARAPEDEVFHVITDLGIFFLMLLGGIELQPRKLVEGTKSAVWVAVGGMFVPLILGIGLGLAVLPRSDVLLAQAVFLGIALAVTAIPVAIRALMDLGRLNGKPGQMIVSAAIVDDVLSLVLLAVLTAMIRKGALPGAGTIGLMAFNLAAFFAISAVAGIYLLPWVSRLFKGANSGEFEFAAPLIFALGESMLAEALGLHFILGAFLAGLCFSRRTPDQETYEDVKRKVSGVTTGFLAPVFFASIGFSLNFTPVSETPLFLAVVLAIAVFGKLLGAGLPALWTGLNKRDAAAVGVGMVGRGAAELVIADIALRGGLFDAPKPTPPIVEGLFSTIVLMAIFTTLLTPVGLRLLWAGDQKAGQGS